MGVDIALFLVRCRINWFTHPLSFMLYLKGHQLINLFLGALNHVVFEVLLYACENFVA
jgi:hypothetical protein